MWVKHKNDLLKKYMIFLWFFLMSISLIFSYPDPFQETHPDPGGQIRFHNTVSYIFAEDYP